MVIKRYTYLPTPTPFEKPYYHMHSIKMFNLGSKFGKWKTQRWGTDLNILVYKKAAYCEDVEERQNMRSKLRNVPFSQSKNAAEMCVLEKSRAQSLGLGSLSFFPVFEHFNAHAEFENNS